MAVDLTLAKQHLRVDHTAEDALITQYLNAAIGWVENYTGMKLTNATVTQTLPAFSSYLPLQWGPDASDLTISYTGADGQTQQIIDAQIVGGRVYAAESWPSTAENSLVVLQYTAGFSTVPAPLDSAVLLLVGEYYVNREVGSSSQSGAMAVEALCGPFRAVGI